MKKYKPLTMFFCYLLFLLAFWLPVYLAFYPGIAYYDLSVQIEQYLTQIFYCSHPLLHTLLIGFFYTLFPSPDTGIALYSALQMIVLASSLSYACVYLYRCNYSKIVRRIILLYFALFPIHSLLAISTTKDVLFASLVLICLIYYFNGRHFGPFGTKEHIILSVLLAITMLFRNNAIYAFIAASIFLGAYCIFWKKHVRILFYLMLSFILFFSADRLLIHTLHAYPSSIKEMSSVPAQQAALVYLESDDASLKEEILDYIAVPEDYIPYLADPIKMQLPFEVFESSFKHFLVLVAKCNLNHPLICIKAFWYNSQGYFDLLHSPYQEEHFFLTPGSYSAGVTLQSKNIHLHDFLLTYFYTSSPKKFSLFNVFFNGALYVWIFLLSYLKGIKEKKRELVIPGTFIAFYLCSLLLGPASIIRYVYPIIVCAPFFMSEALLSKKN